MAEYTPNSNLYKWNKADTKLTTIQEMSANADKLDRINEGAVNVNSFGADPLALNNSQAFIDAITHIQNVRNGRGKLTCPAGVTYKFTNVIGTFDMSNIEIDLNGSTLDFSGVLASSTDSALMFSGTLGSGVALTVNATESSKVIQCNTSTFAVGNMIKVYSNKIWDSTRTSTRIGEICFVQSIDSATQLTLTTPLQDTYNTVDVANIAKITPVENVVLRNGTLIGASGNNEMRGFRIARGLNCLIENVRTKGFDVNHIQLTDCVRCDVDHHYAQEANHSSMGYGVSFADASQDCIVSNSHYTDVRHSFSTNNNVSTSWGIVRRIAFNDSTITDSAPALDGTGGDAIDTHAGSEDIFFNNLTVLSSSGIGINIEANRASINGLSVKGTGSVGIQFLPKADGRKSSISIKDVRLTDIGDGVGSDYGILCNLTTADCDSVIISGAEITGPNAAIRLTSSNGYRFKKGSIIGCTCKVTVSGYAIDINNGDSIAVGFNPVESLSFGIGFTDCANCTANGNIVELKGTSGTGYGIRLTGTTKRSSATGNAVKHSGTLTTSNGVSCSDTATYNMLSSNVTESCTNPTSLGIGTGNVAANNI